jgi:hypothetical protein
MTVTEPCVSDPELEEEEPNVAHLAEKGSVMEGYITGSTVKALCGFVFVPSRDPERYPLCQPCVDVFEKTLREY